MKLYFIEEKQANVILELLQRKHDNEYIILYKNNKYADIAQYSEKYSNVHLATVLVDRLNPNDELFYQ